MQRFLRTSVRFSGTKFPLWRFPVHVWSPGFGKKRGWNGSFAPRRDQFLTPFYICSSFRTSTPPDVLMTPSLLKRTLQQLNERLENVKSVSSPKILSEKLHDLEKKTSDADFWTDQNAAASVLTEIKELKEDLNSIENMETLYGHLCFGYEMLVEDQVASNDEQNEFQVS